MFKYLVSNVAKSDEKYKIEVDSKDILREVIKKTLNISEDFLVKYHDKEFDEYIVLTNLHTLPDTCKLLVRCLQPEK